MNRKICSCIIVTLVLSLLISFSVGFASEIDIRFLNQFTTGVDKTNMCCGPTCCVMMEAYLKNDYSLLTHDHIKESLIWIKNRFNGYDDRGGLGNKNGYGTDKVVPLLREYMGFSDATIIQNMNFDTLKQYIDNNVPVMIYVMQVYDPKLENNRYAKTDHWILCYKYISDTYYFMDPGRSSNLDCKYTEKQLRDYVLGIYNGGHISVVPRQIHASSLKYTVTFNSMGGNILSPVSVRENCTVTEPSRPSLAGCTFSGWYTNTTYTTPWNFSSDTVTGDITLFARWLCQVSFDSKGGSTVSSTTVNRGNTINAPEKPTRSGYLFDGWYKDSNCTKSWSFSTDVASKNTTLYAKWLKVVGQYTVTFDSCGGSHVDSINALEGSRISAPDQPSKDGFKFDGWYKESSLKNAWKFSSDKVTRNITLYARWAAIKTYKVTFDTNGGTSVAAVYIPENKTIPEPTKPTRSGYSFSGWYKDSSLGKPWQFASDTVTKKMTLYAKWSKIVISTPGNLKASSQSITSVQLSWSGVDGATGYQVYSSLSKSNGYQLIGTISGTACINTGLQTGTTYFYKICAYRVYDGQTVYSGYSNVASAIPTAPCRQMAIDLKNSNPFTYGFTMDAGTAVEFKFNAPTSGSYVFQSVGSVDTEAFLYNASRDQIAYDNNSDGINFKISTNVSSGKLYYLYVRGADFKYGGTLQVKITRIGDFGPPAKANPISPTSGSSFIKPNMPTLTWNSVASPAGGSVKYFAETYDCAEPQNSGWITGTTWKPTTTKGGLFNWHVKSIDVITGKESGWGNTWQFTMTDPVPPSKPGLISPANGSSFTMPNMPTLTWSSVSSPSGGTVKYYAETYDCAEPQNSGWITGTSWKPTTSKGGLFNWRVKSIDIATGKESGTGETWKFTMNQPAPPTQPILLAPSTGSTFTSAAPTLYWQGVSSPTGGQVKYYVEIFDGPVYQNSGWITALSWRPSVADGKPGTYNWHVKSIDVSTGKESGYNEVWNFKIKKGESTNLRLDIRRVMYGANDTYVDVTTKVRGFVTNDESLSVTANNSLCGYDPVPNVKKKLVITYRNRWNEEWRVTVQENSSINLSRNDRQGEYLLDGDD